MGKFNLSSLGYLFSSAGESLKRFPFTILSALVVTLVSCYLIEENPTDETTAMNLILCAALGVPLFFAIRVFSEMQKSLKTLWIGYPLGLLVLTAIYFSLPENKDTIHTVFPYVRYGLFSIAIHLLISFAPFLSKGYNNGFWQFNKMLFVRLWLAIFYAIVLYLGLAGALLAVQELFDVHIHGKLYGELWIITSSLINIWIFVSGIKKDLKSLEIETNYPKALKLFAQYILLGLVILYLIILYLYIGKIILAWDWPKGIISYLILGVSVIGYLTTLLLHPYQKLEGNGWIRKFTIGFHLLLLPLCVVLFLAIGMRIDAYGVTINRYFILVLGAWLWCISVFRIWKKDNIKIIPISLAALVALTSFGFWGARSVSERSQVKRLETYLTAANLLKNGKIVQEYDPDGESISGVDHNIQPSDSLVIEIASVLDYLDKYHRFDAIQPWFTQNLDSLPDNGNRRRFDEGEAICDVLGIEQVSSYKYKYTTKNFRLSEEDKTITIEGYNYFSSLKRDYSSSTKTQYDINLTSTYEVTFDKEKMLFSILKEGNTTLTLSLETEMKALYEAHTENYTQSFPAEKLFFEKENDEYKLGILIDDLSLEKEDKEVSINELGGMIFIQTKD